MRTLQLIKLETLCVFIRISSFVNVVQITIFSHLSIYRRQQHKGNLLPNYLSDIIKGMGIKLEGQVSFIEEILTLTLPTQNQAPNTRYFHLHFYDGHQALVA